MQSAQARQVLAAATQALKTGDQAGAEAALAPFFRGQFPGDPDLSNLAGTLRMQQGRLDEASALFRLAVQGAPGDPVFSYNLALALAPGHPYTSLALAAIRSRRGKGFRYSGSWSSRLADSGYHFNHIHPDGWISSCYYVALPDVVRDGQTQQGWIKFGEPAIEVALKDPIRRTLQPAPGRLVLFPSYTWHGTVPFHDRAARTTIAFDVVPA